MSNTSKPLGRRPAALVLSACLMAAAGATVTGAATQGAGAEQLSGSRLEATLKPSGDPNGSGEAHLRLNKALGKVCAAVEWHRIGTPNAAHIHRVSDGFVVVDLTGSVTGGAHCARGVSHRLIGRILDHPRRYYFNVHTAAYPAGAIRGVLHH